MMTNEEVEKLYGMNITSNYECVYYPKIPSKILEEVRQYESTFNKKKKIRGNYRCLKRENQYI